MKLVGFAFFLALIGFSAANASDRISETCSGTEAVQVGTQPPKIVPYALTFSVDLQAKSYCYDRCGPDQSYLISDSSSTPLKLADINHGGQTRLLTYDRKTAVVTDYQSFDAGLARIVRKASAQCRAAEFHQLAPMDRKRTGG